MSDVLRIHFLVPSDSGPIVSEPAGDTHKISAGGRFVCACNPNQIMNDFNRGTSEPWGVRCKACIDSAIFQELKRPKPGRKSPDESEVVSNGCC